MHVGNDTTTNSKAFERTCLDSSKYYNSSTSVENKTDSGSKDSIDSTKDSLNNIQDGNANGFHDSETVLTIPSRKKSKKNTNEVTKFYRYEPKEHKKMVRILTVVAYVICVSMAAIVLSLYYVFLWDPDMTKYRDVAETDCDVLIQKMKLDAKYTKIAVKDRQNYADKLMHDANKFVRCALKQIQKDDQDYDEGDTNNKTNYEDFGDNITTLEDAG